MLKLLFKFKDYAENHPVKWKSYVLQSLYLLLLLATPIFVIFYGLPLLIFTILTLFVPQDKDKIALYEYLSKRAPEYTALANAKAASDSPYIRGKIAVLDVGEEITEWSSGLVGEGFSPSINDFSGVHDDSRLAEIRASKLDELGTIVLLKWGKVLVGKYTDGSGAYTITCEVFTVDREGSVALGGRAFWGGPPPDAKSRRAKRASVGYAPDRHAIAEYIASLPRR